MCGIRAPPLTGQATVAEVRLQAKLLVVEADKATCFEGPYKLPHRTSMSRRTAGFNGRREKIQQLDDSSSKREVHLSYSVNPRRSGPEPNRTRTRKSRWPPRYTANEVPTKAFKVPQGSVLSTVYVLDWQYDDHIMVE